MSKRNEKKLDEAIQQMIDTYGIGRKLTESDLIGSWEEVMGEMINKQTYNIYIYNNKLFVKLKSAALKTELTYRKTDILRRFREYHGKDIVEDIVFLS